jgi:peptidoglycan/xylan/chitin deacetylase (PgdA/CDA1 family)
LDSFSKYVIYNPFIAGFVNILEKIDDRRPNLLRVLTYHHISEPQSRQNLNPSMSIPIADFEQQMGLIRERYTPVPMTEVIGAIQNGNPLPAGAVLVTFDDAYCDFEENAWPVLRRFSIPCAVFVATAYPDQPQNTFWWDRLYSAIMHTQRRDTLVSALGRFPLAEPAQRKQAFSVLQKHVRSLQHSEGIALVDEIVKELDVPVINSSVLNWNDLRRLAREGIALGPHSQTHPLFDRITIEQVRTEVAGSLRDLEREIGSVLPIFAYPGGNFNEQVVQVLKDEGIQLGFTTQRGINDFTHVNNLRLRRINIGRRTSVTILRAELLSLSRYCTN